MYFHTVEIEVGSACNRACSYCPNSTGRRIEQGFMQEETYRRLLDQLVEINFEGGLHYHFYNEPLLNRNLEHLIALSKELLPKTKSIIYSNGTLLDHQRFTSLLSAGVDFFFITEHEGDERRVFRQTWNELTPEERVRVKFQTHQELYLTNRGGNIDLPAWSKELPRTRPCFIPRTSIVVTLKGNVLTCYEDYYQKNTMGNIHQKTLKEIWNEPGYQLFRERLARGERELYDVCRDCDNMKVIN